MKLSALLLGILMFSAPSFAFDINECERPVRSEKLFAATVASLPKAINRGETAYSYGYNLTKFEAPLFCEAHSDTEVTVASVVTVDFWNEEGDVGFTTSTCFLTLEKISDEWNPKYISCEDLNIENPISL